MPRKFKMTLFISILAIIELAVFQGAKAEMVTVENIKRITPLCINAGNEWYSTRYPWNKRGDKIWLHEEYNDYGINDTYKGSWNGSKYVSVCNFSGRGLVWGYVSDLLRDSTAYNYAEAIGTNATDALTALANYKTHTYEMPNTFVGHTEWSRLAGQEDIAYGIRKNGTAYTLEYVDTSIDCAPGAICASRAITGGSLDCVAGQNGCIETRPANQYTNILTWTTGIVSGSPQKLIIVMPKDTAGRSDEYWWDGFWVVDISNKDSVTKVFHTQKPAMGSADFKEIGWFSHGHTQTSPDMEAVAYYGSTSYMSIFQSDINSDPLKYPSLLNVSFHGVHYPLLNECKYATCLEAIDDTLINSAYPSDWTMNSKGSSHASWFSNNDHYFAYQGYCPGNSPCITNNNIWAIDFSRSTKTLSNIGSTAPGPIVSMKSSGSWTAVYPAGTHCSQTSDSSISYGNSPHGMDKMDGSQIYFFGTGGEYFTRVDQICAAGDTIAGNEVAYGRNNGAWIASLAPAATNPADVDRIGGVNIKDIQACIKVITGSNLTYENQCKVLAEPIGNTNIKDIQVIVQAIVNPN